MRRQRWQQRILTKLRVLKTIVGSKQKFLAIIGFAFSVRTIWQSFFFMTAPSLQQEYLLTNDELTMESPIILEENNNKIRNVETYNKENFRMTTQEYSQKQQQEKSKMRDEFHAVAPPRVVFLSATKEHVEKDKHTSISNISRDTNHTVSSNQRPRFLTYPMNTRPLSLSSSSSLPLQSFGQKNLSCIPMIDVSIRPTCNIVHELDFASHGNDEVASSSMFDISLLSIKGSWRSVWKINQKFRVASASTKLTANSTSTRKNIKTFTNTIILKVLSLQRKFNLKTFGFHNTDSIVMERLTASPYVVSSYGFCGQSVLTEFGSRSVSRTVKDPKLALLQRVKLSRDLARGLADLHALQPLKYTGSHNRHANEVAGRRNKYSKQMGDRSHNRANGPRIVFAHRDINPANCIEILRSDFSSDGDRKKYKYIPLQWNDFNLGTWKLHPRDRKTTKIGRNCSVTVPFITGPTAPLWRSPEELQMHDVGNVSSTFSSTRSRSLLSVDDAAKCDVYSFGSLLFYIMTKHQPWWHLEPKALSMDNITAYKRAGRLPHIPSKLYAHQNTSRIELHVLWEAIKACFRLRPSDRLSAYELSEALGTAYEWLKLQRQSNMTVSLDEIQQLFEIQ